MQLFLGGVRGGCPVADTAYAGFGGDTTSLLIEGEGGERIVIDAGTGLRSVAPRLEAGAERHLLLLFTHFHLDHLSGLPSFAPLYEADWRIEMVSRVFEDLTVEDITSSFVCPPLWPLSFDDMASNKRFRILDEDTMGQPSAYQGMSMTWCPLHHPGGSTAFRIEETATGRSVVIATDVEWGQSDEQEQAWLHTLCTVPRPTDLLVFDGKYSSEEYPAYRGWGHSTWQEGVALAREWGVDRVVITHHGAHLDDALAEKRDAEMRETWNRASLARQGRAIAI